MASELFTIGHSTHTIDHFIYLLTMHHINAICDVRSFPNSKFAPQFNREAIKLSLERVGIKYVYCGKELGGKVTNNSSPTGQEYNDYKYLAQTELFHKGLTRLRKGIQNYRLAIMCTEKDPLLCHRAILICRWIRKEDISIKHILEDGNIESHQELEKLLLKSLKLPYMDLFSNEQQMLEQAYDVQSKKLVQQGNNKNSHIGNIDIQQKNAINVIRVFTMGFTKKTAKDFFNRLKEVGIKRLIDIRLNNSSQLAGFTKGEDLRYFLWTICNIDYTHMPELAPTKQMLNDYKKKKITWTEYERLFFELMTVRKAESLVSINYLDHVCLLCSEDEPDQCHRRIVAEYLKKKLGNIEIIHI